MNKTHEQILASLIVKSIYAQKAMCSKAKEIVEKADYFQNVGDKNSYIKLSFEAEKFNADLFLLNAKTQNLIIQYANCFGGQKVVSYN